MAQRDPFTPDLYEIPKSREPLPGSLNVATTVCALVAKVLKESAADRYKIAAEMSRLTGQNITKDMLDAWSAESRKKWRFPLEFLPALEQATGNHEITTWLAALLGGRLLVGKAILEAELGRVHHLKSNLATEEKEIKQRLLKGKP